MLAVEIIVAIILNWVIGLFLVTFVYKQFQVHTRWNLSRIDPQHPGHITAIAATALFWPLVVIVAAILGIVFLFGNFAQTVVTRLIEQR